MALSSPEETVYYYDQDEVKEELRGTKGLLITDLSLVTSVDQHPTNIISPEFGQFHGEVQDTTRINDPKKFEGGFVVSNSSLPTATNGNIQDFTLMDNNNYAEDLKDWQDIISMSYVNDEKEDEVIHVETTLTSGIGEEHVSLPNKSSAGLSIPEKVPNTYQESTCNKLRYGLTVVDNIELRDLETEEELLNKLNVECPETIASSSSENNVVTSVVRAETYIPSTFRSTRVLEKRKAEQDIEEFENVKKKPNGELFKYQLPLVGDKKTIQDRKRARNARKSRERTNNRITDLEEELGQQNARVRQLERENKDLKGENKDLQGENKDLQGENERLKDGMKQKSQKMNDIKREKNEMEREKNEMEREKNEMEREKNEMERGKNGMEQERNVMKHKVDDMKRDKFLLEIYAFEKEMSNVKLTKDHAILKGAFKRLQECLQHHHVNQITR